MLIRIIKRIIKNILPYFLVKLHEKRKLLKLQFTSEEPKIFNDSGILLKTLFLSDEHNQDLPYGFVLGRYPKYIFWDRFNHGLKNHFYTHDKILYPIGKPQKKFALFIESESIVPHFFSIFNNKPALSKEFEFIFTNSENFLNKFDNAVFIPGGGVYYGTETHGGVLNENQYKLKTKNISIVSSNKNMCKLHNFRLEAAKYYKKDHQVDVFGTFDNGTWAKPCSYLQDFRYSIVIENNISAYWFTEKILNCFAAMTIPIYIGAKKIGDFFNINGIIQVNEISLNTLDNIIRSCNEQDYNSRINAIVDNYNRVYDYLCIEDYIYNHYGSNFL